MKRALLPLALLAAGGVCANQQPTGNANPAYFPSGVQAQLRLDIRPDAETVHFIRDTNDPRIITKTYVLQHADPYSIRPYLREMVQSLRVDYDNPAARDNPDYYNLYRKGDMFIPTGVECVRYADGTGIVMVSAEAYRFEDSETGLGIDSLVRALDLPGMLNSSGQPKFTYFPLNRSAGELRELVRLVGANVSNDTVELIGGKDKIEADEELNCLFLNTALYSRRNIEEMLRLYDVPHPEIRISCTVYELDAEDDDMIGLDFQSWKNNDGLKFLSSGAEFSRNANLSTMEFPIRPDGTVNSHYFNFEPKWNTRFLDFLVASGKARVVTTGDLSVKNLALGRIERRTGVMTAIPVPNEEEPEKGQLIEIEPVNNGFLFRLEVRPVISEQAAALELAVATTSLLGSLSDGTLRTSDFALTQKVQLGTGRNRICLGGIEKSQTVVSQGGLPFLKDIPWLGLLFSTERTSIKRTRLVVIAECEAVYPETPVDPDSLEQIEIIRKERKAS